MELHQKYMNPRNRFNLSFYCSSKPIGRAKHLAHIGVAWASIHGSFEFDAMGITLRVKMSILLAVLQAACRHIFHRGFFPHAWPLKLFVIMGVKRLYLAFSLLLLLKKYFR